MKSLIDTMYDLRDILENEKNLDTQGTHFSEAIETLAESQEKKRSKPKAKTKQKVVSEATITSMVTLDVALQLYGTKRWSVVSLFLFRFVLFLFFVLSLLLEKRQVPHNYS